MLENASRASAVLLITFMKPFFSATYATPSEKTKKKSNNNICTVII